MRCISLHQPWATAMALGLKRNETRGWRPMALQVPFPLAIHAAKLWTRAQQNFCRDMRAVCPALPNEIPLGRIVAVCRVVGFARTEQAVVGLSDLEEHWGDYGPGRWAWVTTGLRPLAVPVPFVGKQGFFFVPDAALLEEGVCG